jgi:hypothetical protein
MRQKAKNEDLVLGLCASDTEQRLKSLRAIKNSVIGNRREKSKYISLLPQILTILNEDRDPNVLIQAAYAVGSIATLAEGAKAVVELHGIPKLMVALSNGDFRVVEAVMRALKLLFKNLEEPLVDVYAMQKLLTHFIDMLYPPHSPSIRESAATIIARCCKINSLQKAEVVAAGVTLPLVDLLFDGQHMGLIEASLTALGALTEDSPVACSAVLDARQHDVVGRLLALSKSLLPPQPRFMACVVLTNLARCCVSSSRVIDTESIENAVLPSLVSFLKEPSIGHLALPCLHLMLRFSPGLQSTASDAEIIPHLVSMLTSLDTTNEEGRASALSTVGLLCENVEEHRQKFVDCGGLPIVAAGLMDTSVKVQGAACGCLRSLSRSTLLLRHTFGTISSVAGPLLRLSKSSDHSLATLAVATLANMAVEYSVLKEHLLSLGGIAEFVSLTASPHRKLRLLGVWALSSVAYMAPPRVKASLMSQLPWETVESLLLEDSAMREKGILLLRNLVHRYNDNTMSVMTWSNGNLLSRVLAAVSPSCSSTLREQALYVAVNIAASNYANKDAVIDSGWGLALNDALTCASDAVREAAVWLVINLTWQDGDSRNDDKGAGHRRAVLKSLDVIELLTDMSTRDPCMAVRERATFFLSYFENREGDGVRRGWTSEGEGEGGDTVPPLRSESSSEEMDDDGDDDNDDDHDDDDDVPTVEVDVEIAW